MTIETRRVLGKLGDIRKSRIAFTNFLPIRRWKLMTRITCELLIRDMSDVRKLRIVAARLRFTGCRTPARLRVGFSFDCNEGHHHRQRRANHQECY